MIGSAQVGRGGVAAHLGIVGLRHVLLQAPASVARCGWKDTRQTGVALVNYQL